MFVFYDVLCSMLVSLPLDLEVLNNKLLLLLLLLLLFMNRSKNRSSLQFEVSFLTYIGRGPKYSKIRQNKGKINPKFLPGVTYDVTRDDT
jgi:hypothetical protein